jgi:hypothetical protein
MANIKHVGQIINTQKKCIVVFRELPDDQNSCLLVDTDAAPDWMHDDLMTAVESPGAQSTGNFYEYAERSVFTDGTNMLQTLHSSGRLIKFPTDKVAMTPNNSVSVNLKELNDIIREDTDGAPVVKPDDTQIQPAARDLSDVPEVGAPSVDAPVMGDEELAKSMLSQAQGFEAEAESLKAQAYELDPSLKPRRGRPAKAPAPAE